MLKRSGQSGYTVVELLMTVVLVGLVAAAVAGVYQVSQQSYMRASSLEAAQTGGRAGLDRMANEMRLIGAYWDKLPGAGDSITAASSTSITFMANVHDLYMPGGTDAEATAASFPTASSVTLSISAGDTDDAFKVYVTNPSVNNDYIHIANGSRREVRQITAVNGSTLTLASAPSPPYPAGSLIRDVKRITYTWNTGANTLTRAQGGSGNETLVEGVTSLTFTYFDINGALTTTPSDIREIQIDLTVQGADSSARRMITRVKPRNLS